MSEKFPLFFNDEETLISANVKGEVSISINEDSEKVLKMLKEGKYVMLPELTKNLKTNEFKLVGFHLTLRKENEL